MKTPKLSQTLFVIATLGSLTACGKGTTDGLTVDDSASGAAAGAVGGALSSSSSSGTQAFMDLKNQTPYAPLYSVARKLDFLPSAMADSACPTYHSSTGCTTSGADMWLSYSSCTFAGAASWTGVQEISMSAGAAACGTFPNPGTNGTIARQFVQSAGASAPGQASITTNDGVSATLDDATANLGNFDGDSIAPTIGSGYGSLVQFTSGARSSVSVAHNLTVAGAFNHSVDGSLSVSEVAGASQRTISGSIKVYHNILRVIGTSVFDNVLHEDGCCLPVSGTITTTFARGSNVAPTILGEAAVGKSETLTFTGCGTATLTSYDGSTANVALDRCF